MAVDLITRAIVMDIEIELPMFLIRCQKALASLRNFLSSVLKVIKVNGTQTKPTPYPAKLFVHASSNADKLMSKCDI